MVAREMRYHGMFSIEFGVQHFGNEVAEKTGEAGVAGNFVDEIAPRGHEAGAAAESARGEGVVAAAAGNVTGKLRDGVADEEADDRGEEEGDRHHGAGFERDDGEGEDDVAGGGDVGDGLEDEFGEAEGVGAELGVRVRSVGFGGLNVRCCSRQMLLRAGDLVNVARVTFHVLRCPS